MCFLNSQLITWFRGCTCTLGQIMTTKELMQVCTCIRHLHQYFGSDVTSNQRLCCVCVISVSPRCARQRGYTHARSVERKGRRCGISVDLCYVTTKVLVNCSIVPGVGGSIEGKGEYCPTTTKQPKCDIFVAI